MNLFTAFSNLLIRPLELIFEFIYSIAYMLIGTPGLSIIFLSLAMNLLVLPLYKKADAMQEEARDTEKKLNFWVTHIKKNFSGDERFMILQTYYRQNHYKPTDALRGSVSLLLEVPFFMAAYRFLSNLQMLQGISFGPIPDLGAPDGILVIAGITINVLPVLMTLINLVSGYIYTKGFPLKSKIQLYGMALIFLVLLYDSPSGLVFYWTLNNLFSLVKNIFYKLKNPKLTLGWLCSAISLISIGFIAFVHPMGSPKRQIFVIGLLLLPQLPLVFYYVRLHSKKFCKPVEIDRKDSTAFYFGCIFLALLTGLLIPTTIVANSPAEFVDVTALTNPIWYIFHAFLISVGTFLIWFGIFYMLASPAIKKIMGLGIWVLAGTAVTDYMFFGKGYGNLSPNMKFDAIPIPTASEQLKNLLILLAVIAILVLIWKKKGELARVAYLAAIIALAAMSLVNIPKIYTKANAAIEQSQIFMKDKLEIPLSKTGKNVMVLMMDRAVGLNIPYIFQEKPELIEQYRGFTFYPNTMSHGLNTNIGSPALLGGYEYRPEQMNQNSQQTLQQKHDEALKVMPVLFDGADYRVTILDAPLAGYGQVPESSVFEDYPDIYMTHMMNRYSSSTPELTAFNEAKTIRNLFCYSIFKISPVFTQPVIYARGAYNDPDEIFAENLARYGLADESGQIPKGPSAATGMNPVFMKAFRALQALPDVTSVSDNEKNTFLFLANNVPHESVILKEPEYVPAMVVDNTEYDKAHTDRFTYNGHTMSVETGLQMGNYHSNMAYVILLGQWFDYLRENGVYDNTRIIIAADHGRNVGHFSSLSYGDEDLNDILHCNPVLMVKDFAATDDFSTDLTFMTNADVPSLAMDGLIDNPINPFTGNPINQNAKSKPQILFNSMEHCDGNNGPAYRPATWYQVSGDMFNPANWTFLNGPDILPQY